MTTFCADYRYNYYDGPMMLPDMAEEDFDDRIMENRAQAPGGGRGGALPNEKTTNGQEEMAPEYKPVDTVRKDFPEAWIWSELSSTGYDCHMIHNPIGAQHSLTHQCM